MSEARHYLGELISEAVAVLIIIVIGDSVAGMLVLYSPSPYAAAYWGVAMTWGLSVALAVYVTGAVSGTHANPAVTIALWLYRKFPTKKVLPYMGAQVIGGIVGAAIVYALYGPVIDHFNAVHHITRMSDPSSGGVFFTRPGLAITPLHAFFDEIILTAILIFGIFALTAVHNTMAPMANSSALIIGLLIAAIGGCAGNLEGWPINPARDFGPRVFAFFAGWGPQAFPAQYNYWWIPIVAPLIGGVVGGFCYQFLINPYLPQTKAPVILDSGNADPSIGLPVIAVAANGHLEKSKT
jgi:glycerol uptake facilitator protein